MSKLPFLRKVFKKTNSTTVVLLDAKQLLVNKIGSEQIKKLADKGLSVGVVTL